MAGPKFFRASSILIIKDKGVMTSQPPKRVRISGTTIASRTKFGHNVHHTQAVVISGSDVEWDPREPLGSQKTVSIKSVMYVLKTSIAAIIT